MPAAGCTCTNARRVTAAGHDWPRIYRDHRDHILRATVRLPSRVMSQPSVVPAHSACNRTSHRTSAEAVAASFAGLTMYCPASCRIGHSDSHAPGQQDRDRSRFPTVAARTVLPVPIRVLSLGPWLRSGTGGIVTVGSRRRAPWDGRADAVGRLRTGYGAAEPRPSPLRPRTPRASPNRAGYPQPRKPPACSFRAGMDCGREAKCGRREDLFP